MRFIPRTIHGVLDYVTGLFIAASPWLLGLQSGLAARIPLILGLGAVAYSLLTKYELGLIRIIPFKVHLGLDILSGLTFLAAPWLFNLQQGTEPYIAIGLFEIGAAIFTNPDAKGPLPTSKQT
jgi:hypothetical protein